MNHHKQLYLFLRLALTVIAGVLPLCLKAQVKNLKVETYYVADTNDLTDTLNGRRLQQGAKTYRIYVEVEPGSRIKRIFGDSLHPMFFRSDSIFYNNIDRPNAEFGFEIQLSWMEDAPLLALDSWISLGYAARGQKGVFKIKDPDGGQIAGTNNFGGTATIPGGLLVNTDPLAGIPLTQADGYQTEPILPGSWIDVGFKDAFGNDTTVFGADSSGNEFYCIACALIQTAGVKGAPVDTNQILIAQLTTAGDLSFEINLEIEQIDQNGNPILISYVASDDSLRPGEVVSPYLTYPLQCGCNDPDYLEYSQIYTCLNQDSCKTLIVFGCMDSSACNYNPDANFNLPSLCCYPGRCNDLDISIVCPQLNDGRMSAAAIWAYPSPFSDDLIIEANSGQEAPARIEVLNLTGALVYAWDAYLDKGQTRVVHNLSFLPAGIYLLRLTSGDRSERVRIVKY